MVTNLHVVDQGEQVTVQVNDSKTLSAVFLGYDALKDLAALKACCDPNLQSSPLATLGITPGEPVFAMGYPLGINQASVTSGIVSRVAYDRTSERWMVQTDAPINPGNSGGPLFTLDGEITGINTSVVRESSSGTSVEGFGFAVSARTVLQVLPSLKAGTIGPPSVATHTPTSTPLPRNRFGPVDGSLMHNPADGFIKTEYADVFFRDLMVSATFINPYAATTHGWDYGFILDVDRARKTYTSLQPATDNGWSEEAPKHPVNVSAGEASRRSALEPGKRIDSASLQLDSAGGSLSTGSLFSLLILAPAPTPGMSP